jgi:hypothetical protein
MPKSFSLAEAFEKRIKMRDIQGIRDHEVEKGEILEKSASQKR